jgi:hypothetical protein
MESFSVVRSTIVKETAFSQSFYRLRLTVVVMENLPGAQLGFASSNTKVSNTPPGEKKQLLSLGCW